MKILACLGILLLFACGAVRAQQGVPAPAPAPDIVSVAGAVTAVGPGDVLHIVVFGQPELTTQVTVTADGEITAPFLGVMQVADASPGAIARRIEKGLRDGGYLLRPQVSIEVVQVRSRVVSVLGEVERPGRYAIQGHLSLLEVLALAGGMRNGAAEKAILMRQDGPEPTAERQRIEIPVGNRLVATQAIRDVALQPGDIVFVPSAPQFFVYGEVGHPGAYPIEKGMNVMRAVSLAGGLTPRASERRISIRRTDEATGQTQAIPAELTDPVVPGDVVYVKERFF